MRQPPKPASSIYCAATSWPLALPALIGIRVEYDAVARVETLLDLRRGSIVGFELDVAQMGAAVGGNRGTQSCSSKSKMTAWAGTIMSGRVRGTLNRTVQ